MDSRSWGDPWPATGHQRYRPSRRSLGGQSRLGGLLSEGFRTCEFARRCSQFGGCRQTPTDSSRSTPCESDRPEGAHRSARTDGLRGDDAVKIGAFGSRRVCVSEEWKIGSRSRACGILLRQGSKASCVRSLVGSDSVGADSGRWRLHSVRVVKSVLGVSLSSFRTLDDCRHCVGETLRRSRRAEGISVFPEPFALNPRRGRGTWNSWGWWHQARRRKSQVWPSLGTGRGERSLQPWVRQEMPGVFESRCGFLSGPGG